MVTPVRITELVVDGFRNLRGARIAPDARANVLLGANGHGKTSLLEAIDYAASLRSFRGATRAQLAGRDGKQGDIEKEHPAGARVMEFIQVRSLRIRDQFVKRGVVDGVDVGARHDHDMRQRQHVRGTVPARQTVVGIEADEQHQRTLGPTRAQLLERVDGIAHAAPLQLAAVDDQRRTRRRFQHRRAHGRGRQRLATMIGHAQWNQAHVVERHGLAGFDGSTQMTIVHGVESAAHEPYRATGGAYAGGAAHP